MDRREVMLQRMVKSIGQAVAQGTGDVHSVLKKLGLDANELVKIDQSRQFELIGQHLNNITNPVEKLAAAVALFDREGVRMVTQGCTDG